MRFRPPPIDFSPELRWVLARAFGPAAAAPPAPNPVRVMALAGALDVSARIVARHPIERLAEDLGRRSAISLLAGGASRAAGAKMLVVWIDELASVAAEAKVPLVFLKFAALHLRGVLLPGARPAGDLDVLVPEDACEVMVQALHRRGCRDLDLPAGEHHRAPLSDGIGRVVEIHHCVRGIKGGEAARRATFAVLRETEALDLVSHLPGSCYLPSRELLAAHAAVHGIAQHGFSPGSYSLTRVVADLIDLSRPRNDGALLTRAHQWIRDAVAEDEVWALHALCRRLADGDPSLFAASAQASPEAVLLRHVVAGALDSRYRESLKLRQFLENGGSRSPLRTLATRVRGALRLTDLQIDAIYGKPATAFGYRWRRALRPLDLVFRLIRALGCSALLKAFSWSSHRTWARDRLA